MLNIIKKLLLNIVDDIDTGNSNITEDEQLQIIDHLKSISEPRLSKYQACKFLNMSRAKFDALVADGKLPKGVKQQGFKELSWKKNELLNYIKRNEKKH